MTFEELNTRCNEQGIKYAYGRFKKPTQPPHLVAFETSSENFIADNKVYKKIRQMKMDYTFIDKNLQEQNKVEDIILGDTPWEKTDEIYLQDEECWQVSYFFNIEEEINNG